MPLKSLSNDQNKTNQLASGEIVFKATSVNGPSLRLRSLFNSDNKVNQATNGEVTLKITAVDSNGDPVTL